MPGMHDIRRKKLVDDTQNSNRSRTITRAGVHHIARLAGKVLVAFSNTLGLRLRSGFLANRRSMFICSHGGLGPIDDNKS